MSEEKKGDPRPKDPTKKGANITIEAGAYHRLAETAHKFRWTVPQYLAFVAESLAEIDSGERRQMIVQWLDEADTQDEEASPDITLA